MAASDIGSAAGGGLGAALGGGAGASIGSSLGGAIAGLFGGTDHSAEDRLKAIQDLYARAQDPNFDMSSLTPQEKAVVGQLTPENMQALEMNPAATVQDNGQGRSAQVAALQKLQDLGNGGLNLQDQSDLNNIRSQAATANKGQQDAILANAAAKGQGGDGQSLAAQLIAQQNTADTAANQGTQVAANAQMRALQALQAAGSAGSNLRSSDNSLSAQNAQIMNQFNAANFANKQGIADQNVANRNSAQATNLANAQNIANQNADTQNAFKQYNQQNQNSLKQQQFGNDLSKINGQANLGGQVANQMNANAAGKQAQNQGLGQALGGIAGSYLDPNKKVQ